MMIIGTTTRAGAVALQANTGEDPLRVSARPCGLMCWGGWLFDPHPLPANPADPPSLFPKTPKENRFRHRPWCVRLISYHDVIRTPFTFSVPSPYSTLTYCRKTGEPWDRTKTDWWRAEWGHFAWGSPQGDGPPLREAEPGIPTPTGHQLYELALRTGGPGTSRFYPDATIPLPRRGLQGGILFPNEGGFTPCRLDVLMPPGTLYNLFVTATYFRKSRARGETGSEAERGNVWIEVLTSVCHVALPCVKGGA